MIGGPDLKDGDVKVKKEKRKRKRQEIIGDSGETEAKTIWKERRKEKKNGAEASKEKKKGKKHVNTAKEAKGQKRESKRTNGKVPTTGKTRCKEGCGGKPGVQEKQTGKKRKKGLVSAENAGISDPECVEPGDRTQNGAAGLQNGMSHNSAGCSIGRVTGAVKKKKGRRKRKMAADRDDCTTPGLESKGPPKQGQQVSSNWGNLKKVLDAEREERLSSVAGLDDRRKKRHTIFTGDAKDGIAAVLLREEALGTTQEVVALDCEMVTAMGGDKVVREVVARVGVVDNKGDVLLDSFARPEGHVVDFRTPYSGVRPRDLRDAPQLEVVLERVQQLIKGCLVVGHAIHNDFRALGFAHPNEDIRDTSRYRPLMRAAGGILQTVSLKKLAHSELGMAIQIGEHNPVEDARAALYLYHKHRSAWEQSLASKNERKGG